ncbi:uncharacterized protein A1O9_06971 [Exophiala aquamarina CBS 119918]|uniref:Major facilitator superfamily (MFS) profile domain-containing protein n=1 Tax=Exophiala aquamarina CBS 119918 TaxID=1182545 RepID=A0A072PAC8_9EURO|nr:uncharacterized protein A1O9_06971 [Exophiala aquamarina CBS 119918]KEF56781.1 hypothetical protein A1O9_06971 [Exophiala aquamarina CBS 119918]
MTPPRPDNRRSSTDQQHPSHPHSEDTASLSLSRTRSQEFDFAESVAIQEVVVEDSSSESSPDTAQLDAITWKWSTRYLVFLCAFLTSLSFGVTQVPLVYVFRLMTCDAYYKDHSYPERALLVGPPTTTSGSLLSYVLSPEASYPLLYRGSQVDRCSKHEIETSTALSISLLGASTTVFGIINLFLTSSLIKRIGLKATLLIQIFFPAVRLLIQNVGVEVWGSAGINVIQWSQIVSIVGGPSGYLLVLNTFITEVVEHEGRTAALGRLNGSMMFGAASGFLLGGFLAEDFGIKAPFRLTFILFLSSCVFVVFALPYVPPAEGKISQTGLVSSDQRSTLFTRFFKPLTVFTPRKFIGKDGVIRTEYGACLLACGVYLGILATGYLATLLQLFSTDVFGFGTRQNGVLIFMYSMLRGLFLTFAFPKLIALGRSYTTTSREDSQPAKDPDQSGSTERDPLLSSERAQTSREETDSDKDRASKKEQTFHFDLTYTRYSLLADGMLTLLCSFVQQGWQMYLVAAVLPFSAGTASASKGTILQMVGSSDNTADRTDALAGLSLVENLARMSTTLVFGVIFAAFAGIGRTELVFTCNAAVALIGFGVLLFSRFPLEGSRRLDKEDPSASAD